MSSAGRDALLAMLSRLKDDLARANLAKPQQASDALRLKYPLQGDYLSEVRRLCERGLDDGWLCGDADGGRSGRLASSSRWFPFSIDAEVLSGEGEAHGHPKGEVGLCWSVDGAPKLSGSEPGWHVFAPGSKHAPRVTGGRLFLLSFRPEGAVELGVKVPQKRKRKAPARKRAGAAAGSRRSQSAGARS